VTNAVNAGSGSQGSSDDEDNAFGRRFLRDYNSACNSETMTNARSFDESVKFNDTTDGEVLISRARQMFLASDPTLGMDDSDEDFDS
jgi:hypothetical protein